MNPFTKQLSGLLIVGTTFFFACKSSETGPANTLSLGMNQSARLSTDVLVKVDSIQDSRCPINAICIWEGVAVVKVSLSNDTQTKSLKLSLNSDSRRTRADSSGVTLGSETYEVVLRGVTPYREVSKPDIIQSAQIKVTKR